MTTSAIIQERILTAAAFSTTPAQTMVGGVVGLTVAAALGWLIFARRRKMVRFAARSLGTGGCGWINGCG